MVISITPKQYLLHRLVAKVFIPNPEKVNHKDGNKKNTHVNNLERCTCAENQIHKVKTGLSNIKIWLEYDKNKSSQKDVSHINIPRIAGGFIFRYIC